MVTPPWIRAAHRAFARAARETRRAALVALAMMIVFTIAVAAAWARGLDFRCGCFSKAGAQSIGAKKFLENVALTLLAAGAFTRREGPDSAPLLPRVAAAAACRRHASFKHTRPGERAIVCFAGRCFRCRAAGRSPAWSSRAAPPA